MKAVYELTPGDKAIISTLDQDPNIFANYYFRSKGSGTYWTPGSELSRWKKGYQVLLDYWMSIGRPLAFDFKGVTYQVIEKHDKSKKFPNHPVFFHNHGRLLLDWGKHLYKDRTAVRTIIGGFGSGKSELIVQIYLILAATLPGFRGLLIGPQHKQAKELFKIAKKIITGTIYEERFVHGMTQPPDGKITIKNDLVGESTLEFYSIFQNSESLLTITADCGVIDQAEQIDNLDSTISDIGSRFRGREHTSGREMLGSLTLIANTNDNLQLWDIFDRAEEDPEGFLSLNPKSVDNPYLTDADLIRFYKLHPDEKSRQEKLEGARPMGSGKHFSKKVLESIRDVSLDQQMDHGIREGLPGYVKLSNPKIGTYEFLLPYDPERKYLVMSDPGTANPPERDSPPIMIWDITGFPGDKDNPVPARMVGFVWVFGHGNINNWANRYSELVRMYHAQLSNGFDSTGFQAGYSGWISTLHNLHPEQIKLSGAGKSECLNASKILSGNAMMLMPFAVTSIYAQLSRYELPEPSKMRQDLTMCFIMSAFWLHRLYFVEDNRTQRPSEIFDQFERMTRVPMPRHAPRRR